ncbi:MAG: OmpH family outer membrane protein [Prevotella sp.]|nr:OmpH family outer membrane protein [Prevotella sp.]
MKKSSFVLVVAAFVVVVFASCNNAPKENDTRREAPRMKTELKIAYVEVDSIMTQYTFAKESQDALQKKAQNIQNTLAAKQQALEAAATKLQQDYQANALTQEQAQTRQAAIQRQSNDLQSLNQRLTNEFQAETDKFNDALSDSVQHYLAAYNKDKHYALILTKVGDNILFADKKLDITKEVIAGLNKAYKKPRREAAEKK